MGTLDVLKASVLTPDFIRQESNDPNLSFKIMVDANDASPEKLEALMKRKDVTGFKAYQILKEASNQKGTYFFPIILNLYIKRFILKGSKEDSLRYTVMTLHFWVHFIGYDDEFDYKSRDTELLLEVRSVLLSFINRWPIYQNSAVELINKIEKCFFTTPYDEESKFPGDTESHFVYTSENHVAKELRKCIFPFIGMILRAISLNGKYYQDSNDLLVLAINKYFGDLKQFGKVYIETIKNTFSLDDIAHFVPDDEMEKFLLSPNGASVNTRFCNLCENSPADKILKLIDGRTHYAGFYFVNNKAYMNLSLEEKADFLAPFSSSFQYNFKEEQQALLRLWINDSEWNNPKRSISELTLLALKKRHLFSFNSRWLFSEMTIVLLQRKYGENVLLAKNENKTFLNKIAEGLDFIQQSDYQIKFDKPELLLAMYDVSKETVELYFSEIDTYSGHYRAKDNHAEVIKAIEKLFFKHVASCLTDWDSASACEAVVLAEAFNNSDVMNVIVKKDLDLEQILSLLRGVSLKETDVPAIAELRAQVIKEVNKIESDKDCLQTVIYLLVRHGYVLLPEIRTIVNLALNKKSFADIYLLITTLTEIMENNNVRFSKHEVNISARDCGLIYNAIFDHVKTQQINQEEALFFCKSEIFFDNLQSWSWYYGLYEPKTISELFSINSKNLYRIFSHGPQKDHLLKVWKSTPLPVFIDRFTKEFIFSLNIRLHEHPEWKNLSLQKRLDLLTSGNESYHKSLISSIAEDFEIKWKEGEWTKIKYIEVIQNISSYEENIDNLAELALSMP